MKRQSLSQNLFSKLKRLSMMVSPEPPIAGVEVNNSTIRLVAGRDSSRQIALRLPPGIIEGGRLKNREGFKSALGELYRRLPSKSRKHLNVVLTIPANDVFVQTVTLPPQVSGNLEEAAKLNLQMVSPLNLEQSYYDWQRLDGSDLSGKPIELLGAFVLKEIVDEFVRALEEAGFSIAAVEFTSLSLLRELKRQGRIELGQTYLAAEVKPEGITFILARDDHLLFHSFTPWSSIQGKEGAIARKDFINVLADEVNTISNFYGAHWGGAVGNLIFIASPDIQDGIKEALKGRSLTFFSPEELSGAVGAASRSLLQEGKEISLLGTSYLEIFKQNRVLSFVSLWRSILVAVLGFLLLLSLGSDLLLRELAQKTKERDALSLNEPEHRELTELKEEASKFNQSAALIRGIQQEEPQIGLITDSIDNLAGVEIEINRIYIPSPDAAITISGIASGEQAAVGFKNRLASKRTFAEVDLPLSGIIPQTGGGVAFTIHFWLVEP
ncbi:MAG: pilus assembly protein PilM [Candidatus Colwellbacteria bacterium]|nr:pilus assembly protein PilM [Candidatus Colwellbacteria bacterium]